MTNAELIQTIRAEIERRKEKHSGDYKNGDATEFHRIVEDDAILSFLYTLEEEQDKVLEGEVILNGHGLLVDVTKWGDGYKLKVIIKEN